MFQTFLVVFLQNKVIICICCCYINNVITETFHADFAICSATKDTFDENVDIIEDQITDKIMSEVSDKTASHVLKENRFTVKYTFYIQRKM